MWSSCRVFVLVDRNLSEIVVFLVKECFSSRRSAILLLMSHLYTFTFARGRSKTLDPHLIEIIFLSKRLICMVKFQLQCVAVVNVIETFCVDNKFGIICLVLCGVIVNKSWLGIHIRRKKFNWRKISFASKER